MSNDDARKNAMVILERDLAVATARREDAEEMRISLYRLIDEATVIIDGCDRAISHLLIRIEKVKEI